SGMTHSFTSLSTIEEWNRKAFDFSENYDSLNDVFLNLFDVFSAVLKDSDASIVQRALVSLDSKRSIWFRLDEIK
ncbi:hypothetical protein PMAYCL1PPCAC_13937, partial [Pristionchus mayeri]